MAVNQHTGSDRATETGLTAEKVLVPGDGGMLQVWFEFESSLNERVSFRVVDPLPDAVDPGDVGFRPVHSGDRWTLHPEMVWYADTIAPNGTIETVYAVKDAGPEVARELRGSPSIETVEVVGGGT